VLAAKPFDLYQVGKRKLREYQVEPLGDLHVIEHIDLFAVTRQRVEGTLIYISAAGWANELNSLKRGLKGAYHGTGDSEARGDRRFRIALSRSVHRDAGGDGSYI
jgi:hypothetical protein